MFQKILDHSIYQPHIYSKVYKTNTKNLNKLIYYVHMQFIQKTFLQARY